MCNRDVITTESLPAERTLIDNPASLKRVSNDNVQKELRIGNVALQLDLAFTLTARSVRMALKEAMHKLEGDLMDRIRVVTSATANLATYAGNFCRFQVRPGGYMPGRDEMVLAIELAFGQVCVSLGMMERGAPVMDPDYSRVVRSTGQEIIDAIMELANLESDESLGVSFWGACPMSICETL